MKIFFDTEFVERGHIHPIDMISIGLVREDGVEYYAENMDARTGFASQWVKANVLTKLVGGACRKPRRTIAREIEEFVGWDPEFWAYYADYDWVVLCQLYGTMLRLPESWPKYCLDVKHLCVELGDPRLPEQKDEDAHNALNDARWTKGAYEFLLTRKLLSK